MNIRAEAAIKGVLEPAFTESKSFAQIYTLTTLCDDATYIQVQFTLTNLGVADKNAGCRILVIRKGRAPLAWSESYGRRRWSYAGDSAQTLNVGKSRISIGHDSTSITAVGKTVRVDVAFAREPVRTAPPDANITAGNRFFEHAILIPWAAVRVRVSRPGQIAPELTGFAMLELSRSTTFPADICRGWITFRGYHEATHFTAAIRLPPGAATPATGWAWKNLDAAPSVVAGLAVESATGAERGKVVGPILARDGSFRIDAHAQLYRFSVIDELGTFLGAIVKLFIGEPVTYYYQADATLAGGGSRIPGVAEILRFE